MATDRCENTAKLYTANVDVRFCLTDLVFSRFPQTNTRPKEPLELLKSFYALVPSPTRFEVKYEHLRLPLPQLIAQCRSGRIKIETHVPVILNKWHVFVHIDLEVSEPVVY